MVKRALIFSIVFTLVVIVGVFFLFDSLALRDIAKRVIITQAYYKLNLKIDVADVKFSYFRPAIIVDRLKLEKDDEKLKINLFAPRAVIRFNPIQLIRGEIKISAVNFDSPSLYMETKESNEALDLKKINISKIVDKLLKAKIEGASVDNANFKIRFNTHNKKIIDISSPRISISIRKGLTSNYILKLSADGVSSPVEYLSNLDLQMDVKNSLVKIEKFNVGVTGGKAAFSGYISNLSDVSQLKLDVFWHLNFNLYDSKKYSTLLKFKSEQDYPGGFLTGNGGFSGFVFQDIKASRLDGNIKIKDFAWYSYKIPQIELHAKYLGDHVILSKLDVSDGTKSIEAKDTTISLKYPYAIKGKGIVNDIELSKYLEIFNIKRCLSYFTVGGSFTFTGSIKPEFKISGLFDLKAKDFWVLKKKGLVPNKANSIINFKNGSIYGFVHFSSGGAYFDNCVAKSENNAMVVSGWIRDTGSVDLDIKSDLFSMNTYGRISELPLKGTGSVSTKIIVDEKGDFKSDGQISLDNAELMEDYYMGTISSRVVYDGDILSFRDIKGKTGSSTYSGYTELDFDKIPGPTIKGHGIVSDAYSGDIYKLLKKEDRIPGAPSGLLNAVVKFEGYPSWETIKLDSRLKLKNVEFFSERFDELVANFVWDKGELSLNDLYLTKGKGVLDFKGTRKNGNLKMDVNSKNLSLSDFAILSKRNVDLSGGVSIKGELEHIQKRLSGDIRFNISDLVVGGQKLKPVNLDLALGQQMFLKFNVFGQEAKGEVFKESEDTYVFRSKFIGFNFYPIGNLILRDIENFKTDMNGEVEVRFNKNLSIKSAKIRIDDFSLVNSFVSARNKGVIHVDYSNDIYSIKPFSIMTDSDNNKCILNFDRASNNDTTIKGCITTGLLKIFKGGVTGARGKFDLDMVYGNKLKGTIIPKDVEIMTAEQKLGGVVLGGRINVDNNFAKLDGLTASIGGANVTFTGGMDLDKLIKLKSIYPVAKVGLHADKLYFQYPEGLNGKWSGDINLTGSGLPYDLTGVFYLFEASYRKDFNLNMLGTGRSKKSKVFYLSKKEKHKFNLDVKVKSGDDLIVKNNIFDGDLIFDLNIKGTELEPKIVGSIDLNRGEVTYLDNVFSLTAGRFKFKEDTGEPAVYQLESEAKIGDYQVYLHLVSNKGEPDFKLTSVPPLTEDKIMALMATGDVQTDFSEKSGYGMSTGAGGQLVTEGLGVTNALKNKTGVGFRVKAPTTQGSTLPDIELQKDLTNDIKVIYGKSLGDTTNKQQVNVQYEVNRNIQLKLLLQEEVKKENVSQEPTNAGVDVNFKFEF